jgi:hypothetical protein
LGRPRAGGRTGGSSGARPIGRLGRDPGLHRGKRARRQQARRGRPFQQSSPVGVWSRRAGEGSAFDRGGPGLRRHPRSSGLRGGCRFWKRALEGSNPGDGEHGSGVGRRKGLRDRRGRDVGSITPARAGRHHRSSPLGLLSHGSVGRRLLGDRERRDGVRGVRRFHRARLRRRHGRAPMVNARSRALQRSVDAGLFGRKPVRAGSRGRRLPPRRRDRADDLGLPVSGAGDVGRAPGLGRHRVRRTRRRDHGRHRCRHRPSGVADPVGLRGPWPPRPGRGPPPGLRLGAERGSHRLRARSRREARGLAVPYGARPSHGSSELRHERRGHARRSDRLLPHRGSATPPDPAVRGRRDRATERIHGRR